MRVPLRPLAAFLLVAAFSLAAARPLPAQISSILSIGAVQGAVSDAQAGMTHRSPFAPASGNGNGQTVTVQGVIYEKTLARTSSGALNYGFFIQNTAATADTDPNTSDGLFVFHGTFTTLRRDGGGFYPPRVGDEVVLRGPVVEFFNLTQLSNPFLVQVVRSGVDLERETRAFVAEPPLNLEAASRYWERREGMRAQVPQGSIAVSGLNVFPNTADGELWLARPEALPGSGYARRVFRDPHPLDNNPAQLFDDGNGYRIVLGSLGVKASANDSTVLLSPARTFDSLGKAATGGVYFAFNKYQVMVEAQISLVSGADPSRNAPPRAPRAGREFSIATYNVENLYDFRDDPFDNCDFNGNSGCPGVNPPFDFVPASDASYQAKLQEMAAQIKTDLHAPDILLVQEAEDQDICSVSGTALVCGTTNNADGKPDTLQELALTIARLGGPRYDAASDRNGADDRGIVSGFLYRTDRVQLLPATATDPVLGSSPKVSYRGAALPSNTDVQNPKTLNAVLPADVDRGTGVDGNNVFTRAPQVGLFRIWRTALGESTFTDLYLISNHFSSTPNARVGQRKEQAAYNAAIIAALPSGTRAVVGGDLNVFPRPDDPFSPGDARFPSDQLAPLYTQGLTNLWERLVAEVPASAYSYMFEGQAQTLDQLFVTPAMLAELAQIRAAHVNADWPADTPGDGPRGLSDHDPQVALFDLMPTVARLEALVRYFDTSGDITGNETARILLDRLARAGEFAARGQQQAYEAQLRAFINQVRGFAPRQLSAAAGQALSEDARLLLSLGPVAGK